MNGNRTKYTYTPAYGMNKRGSKKSMPMHEAPEAPDFTQVPDPTVGVPLQQAYQQPVYQMQSPQAGSMPTPSYFNAAPKQPVQYPQQPMQQPMQQPVQATFAAPSFVQPGYSQIPPVQNQMPPASFQQPPLRAGAMTNAPAQGFNGRAQGFVPTAAQQQTTPMQPVAPQAPQIGWSAPKAPQQTIPPFSGVQSAPVQQPMGFQPAQPQPQGFPPLQPVTHQPGFTIQQNTPATPPRQASFDADKLWGIIIFILLPLLFIPCLFVSANMDVLRYIFIGFTVVGLGGMWYRQLYTPTSRLVVSIVYVALCITTIAMVMQGGSSARQASGTLNQQSPQQTVQVVTETPAPSTDENMQAAVVTPTETPAPIVTGPSEAEKRLSSFMELWKINNTSEMVNYVQPSWCNQQSDPAAALFLELKNRTPEDFVIEEIAGTETDSSRTITMRATINKNTGKAPVVYRFMIMMVKEGNDWYVNPNSLATNDTSVNTAEEENVVKTQGSGAVTEPPRETVTPAPPASTLLYYNQGGNYYHMDPQCPSVAKDYLPFDASFPYSDLRSYNRTLLPCLNCNAPIDPL